MELTGYFDAMGKATKEYSRYQEPVCKRWNLTQNEMAVLLFLFNNPGRDRAADIVECRGIAKSHVSLAVSNLERRKILARHFEPTDRRTSHLALTEHGKEIAQEGKERQRAFFQALYAGVGPEEMELLRHLGQKILTNIAAFGKNETE